MDRIILFMGFLASNEGECVAVAGLNPQDALCPGNIGVWDFAGLFRFESVLFPGRELVAVNDVDAVVENAVETCRVEDFMGVFDFSCAVGPETEPVVREVNVDVTKVLLGAEEDFDFHDGVGGCVSQQAVFFYALEAEVVNASFQHQNRTNGCNGRFPVVQKNSFLSGNRVGPIFRVSLRCRCPSCSRRSNMRSRQPWLR